MSFAQPSRRPFRVPTSILTIGPVLSVAIILALSWNTPGAYAETIPEAASWTLFGLTMIEGFIVAAALSAWFTPHISSVVLAISFQPWATEAIDHPAYVALMWIWPTIVVVDTLGALRQRALAKSADDARGQPLDVFVLDTPVIRWAIASIIASAAVIGLLIWNHQRTELIELGERAVPGVGVVTSQDLAFDAIDMRVSGTVHEFFVNDASAYPIGSSRKVFVDPTGQRRPYGTEDADPDSWSDLAVPIGGGIYIAAMFGLVPGVRRRRVRELAASGPVWDQVLIREHPTNEGVEVYSLDDPDCHHPVAFLPHLEPVFPVPPGPRAPLTERLRESTRDFWNAMRGRLPDDLWSDDDYEDDDHDDSWSTVTDQPVSIAGLFGNGSLCLVKFGDDAVMAANVRPARDRWTVRYIGAHLISKLSRSGRHTADLESRGTDVPQPPERYAWHAFVRRTAKVGPVLISILGFMFLRLWFQDEALLSRNPKANFGTISFGVLAAGIAARWWARDRPPVSPSRYGLRLTSTFADAVIPSAEIGDVQRDADGIEIELESGGGVFVPAPSDRPAHESEAILDSAELVIARARAMTEEAIPFPSALPKYLPSSGTLVAGSTLLITMAPAVIRF